MKATGESKNYVWKIVVFSLAVCLLPSPFLLYAEAEGDADTAMLIGRECSEIIFQIWYVDVGVLGAYFVCSQISHRMGAMFPWIRGQVATLAKFFAIIILLGTLPFDYSIQMNCLEKLHGKGMIVWENVGVQYAVFSLAFIGLLLRSHFAKSPQEEGGGRTCFGRWMQGLYLFIIAMSLYMVGVWGCEKCGYIGDLLEPLNSRYYYCLFLRVLISCVVASFIFRSEWVREKPVFRAVGYLALYFVINAVPDQLSVMSYYLYGGNGMVWLSLGCPCLLLSLASLIVSLRWSAKARENKRELKGECCPEGI